MLEALFHGKLSREQENMEDLLTSNTFGLFQYTDPDVGLFPFLALAEDRDGNCPFDSFSSDMIASYRFWPRWAEPGLPACEPDIEITLETKGVIRHIIGVEAKYFSGKSLSSNSKPGQPTDQLAKQWANLRSKCESHPATPLPTLVYLTADSRITSTELQMSISDYQRHYPEDSMLPRICWLSWRRLMGIFRDHSITLLRDIGRLAARLNLTYYGGISPVTPVRSSSWRFSQSTKCR